MKNAESIKMYCLKGTKSMPHKKNIYNSYNRVATIFMKSDYMKSNSYR